MQQRVFSNPGPTDRAVALWMLNDDLSPDRLRRQLKRLHEGGWSRVITRTFFGLRTPYLSADWNNVVHVIIDEAKRLDMKVWLQAGFMPSGVPDLPKHVQAQVLLDPSDADPPKPNDTLLMTDRGESYHSRRVTSAVDLMNPDACTDYIEGSYTKPLVDEFGSEFGKTVESIWVDEPHFAPPRLPWSEALPPAFGERWGYDLVERLPALFHEEEDYETVRHDFWRTILDLLLNAYFRQVGEWCRKHDLLFSGHLMGEDTLQAQIGWTGACMPCYEHMGLPGIDHLTRDMDWPAGRSFILTPKQCSSASRQLGKGRSLAEMFGVSSEGLTFADRRRIGTWLFMLGIDFQCIHGAFYSVRGLRKRFFAPHLSDQQPWWPENRLTADYFARLSYLLRSTESAAEVLVLHNVESAFGVYNARGVTNPHDRRHDHPDSYRLTDSIITLSESLQAAHIDYDYGDETLLDRHGSVEDATSGRPSASESSESVDSATEDSGSAGSVRLRIGDARYSVVVLPELRTIRRSTLNLLREFLENGGRIVSVGSAPSLVDGRREDGLDELVKRIDCRANNPAAIAEALERVDRGHLRVAEGPDAGLLWTARRTFGDWEFFFLWNSTTDRTIVAELSRTTDARRIERWNPEDGSVSAVTAVTDRAADSTPHAVSVSLNPGDLHVYRAASDPQSTADGGRDAGRVTRSVELIGPYRVTRDRPNVLPLDFCRFQRGSEPSGERIPLIAVQEVLVGEQYTGPITVEYEFKAEFVPTDLALAVEDAEPYAISVNGTRVRERPQQALVDPTFGAVPIATYCTAGVNTITLTRDFESPPKPAFRLAGLFQRSGGVELEPPILTGSFAVRACRSTGRSRRRAVRLAPDFVIEDESGTSHGDVVTDGYPFYAGTVGLEATVNLQAPRAGEELYLVLCDSTAPVTGVSVNGVRVECRGWRPYEFDITSHVAEGTNAVRWELVTSLRNLFGPYHRPDGEPDDVWGDHWSGRSRPHIGGEDYLVTDDWWKRRDEERIYWTDDYFVVPIQVIGTPRVEYRQPG